MAQLTESTKDELNALANIKAIMAMEGTPNVNKVIHSLLQLRAVEEKHGQLSLPASTVLKSKVLLPAYDAITKSSNSDLAKINSAAFQTSIQPELEASIGKVNGLFRQLVLNKQAAAELFGSEDNRQIFMGMTLAHANGQTCAAGCQGVNPQDVQSVKSLQVGK